MFAILRLLCPYLEHRGGSRKFNLHRAESIVANPPQESDSIQLPVRHVDEELFNEIARQLNQEDVLDVALSFG
jgi:hypothetical protein